MRCQSSAAYRYERNNKRIYAQFDEYPRGFLQRLHSIAEPRKEIGTDLSSAENLHGSDEGF